MRDAGLIKISEMASLHGISRQTLILYDKNGLLKPVKVAENGYRYYSVDQIPRLRLICLLKEMGVPLCQIAEHLEHCTPASMRALLKERADKIALERERLAQQQAQIEQLGALLEHVELEELNAGIPSLRHIEGRRAIFSPFPSSDMDPKLLHLTLMDAWCRLLDEGTIPSRGFGALLQANALVGARPLEGAGSIVILPRNDLDTSEELVSIPEGTYAVMHAHAMPYDLRPIRTLMAWMRERGFVPAGPVVSCCLLDSMYYDERRTADFCRLEVLVAK
ncbi:MAG: MerR family transcriptional regulator [Coriobacteriales bacterium]|nr:MerR family transcriptional regulator [Coriobacteriales bacterium]